MKKIIISMLEHIFDVFNISSGMKVDWRDFLGPYYLNLQFLSVLIEMKQKIATSLAASHLAIDCLAS